MKPIHVSDMHCSHCVARIEQAFAAAAIPCTVDLDKKTVAVPEGALPKALETLEDLGFTPTV